MLPKARLLRNHMRSARLRLKRSGKMDRIQAIKPSRWRILRGDKVQLIAGPDKGRQGTVLLVDRKLNRVYVEDANLTSTQLPDDSDDSGYRTIEHEAPVHVSNVMLVDPVLGVPTKVTFRYVPADGAGGAGGAGGEGGGGGGAGAGGGDGGDGGDGGGGGDGGDGGDGDGAARLRRVRVAKKSGTIIETSDVARKDYQTARSLKEERGAGAKDTLPEDVLEETFVGLRLDEQWREASAPGIGARGTTPVFDGAPGTTERARRRKAAAAAVSSGGGGSSVVSGGEAVAAADAAAADDAAESDEAPTGGEGDDEAEEEAKPWWKWS